MTFQKLCLVLLAFALPANAALRPAEKQPPPPEMRAPETRVCVFLDDIMFTDDEQWQLRGRPVDIVVRLDPGEHLEDVLKVFGCIRCVEFQNPSRRHEVLFERGDFERFMCALRGR